MNQCARFRRRWTALVVAGCLNTAAAAEVLELMPGVLIDPGRSIAYLADPAGYMHALNLGDGRSIWTSSERVLPIAMVQQQLLVPHALPQLLAEVGRDGREHG